MVVLLRLMAAETWRSQLLGRRSSQILIRADRFQSGTRSTFMLLM